MNNHHFCTKCGSALSNGDLFCSDCGSRIEEPTPVCCPNCNTPRREGSTFCFACGARIVNNTAPVQPQIPLVTPQPPTTPNKISGKFVRGVITKSLVCLVSLIAFIFAFLPVVSYNIPLSDYSYNLSGYDDFTINYSAIDSITFFFDSIQSLDSEDIQDSSLLEEWNKLNKKLINAKENDYSEKEISSIVSRLYFISLRLSYQQEDFNTNGTLIFSSIISLVYIVCVVALLTFAIIDLLVYLLKKSDRFGRISLILFSLIPPFAISLYTSVYYSCPKILSSYKSSSPTGLLVTMITLSLFVLAWVAVERIFITEKVKTNVKEIVKRSLSIVAATLLLFSVFMPMFSFEVRATFNGSDERRTASCYYDAAIFSSFNLSESEADNYNSGLAGDNINRMLNRIASSYTKRAFEQGKATSESISVIKFACLGYGAADYAWLIALVPILMQIVSLLAAIIIWQNILAIVSGKSLHKSINLTARILGILPAALSLAITVFFDILTTYNLQVNYDNTVKAGVSLGFAAILCIEFAIFALCVPINSKKQSAPIPETICVPVTETTDVTPEENNSSI